MRAGPLRRRVEVQQRVESQIGGGETDWEWQAVETLWAEISSLSGRELFVAQQVASEVTVRIRIRMCSRVMPKMRAVETVAGVPTYYDITAVLPDERRTYMSLMCVVRGADGWRG